MTTFRIQAFPPVSLVPPGILRTPSDKYRGIVSLLIFAIIVSEKIGSYTKKLFRPLLLTSKGTLLHVLRPLLCDLEDSWPPFCKLITKRYGIHLFFPKVLMSLYQATDKGKFSYVILMILKTMAWPCIRKNHILKQRKGSSRRSHDGPQSVLKKHIIKSQPQKDVSHGLTAFYPEPSLHVSLFQ